jgi:hypothetical protein
MEQIQQKGSRDGNAIFAQMRPSGHSCASAALAPAGDGRFNPAHGRGLIPGRISRKSAPAGSEKDVM